jgi:hypothetical protein
VTVAVTLPWGVKCTMVDLRARRRDPAGNCPSGSGPRLPLRRSARIHPALAHKELSMTFVRNCLALGTLLCFAGVAQAAPSITVSRVSNTATTITIKVTGSGFSKKKPVDVEIDQNGAFSGNLPQFLRPTSDSTGKISQQATINGSSACLIGVWATDSVTGLDSNAVDLSIPSPCVVPAITAHLYPNTLTVVEYVASHFTPNGGITVEFYDTTTGETEAGNYAVLGDGSSKSHYGLGGHCGHVIQVTGFDQMNDKASNTVSVKLCP